MEEKHCSLVAGAREKQDAARSPRAAEDVGSFQEFLPYLFILNIDLGSFLLPYVYSCFLHSCCHEVAMLSPVPFHFGLFGGNIIFISVPVYFAETLLLLDAAVGADALLFTA